MEEIIKISGHHLYSIWEFYRLFNENQDKLINILSPCHGESFAKRNAEQYAKMKNLYIKIQPIIGFDEICGENDCQIKGTPKCNYEGKKFEEGIRYDEACINKKKIILHEKYTLTEILTFFDKAIAEN